MATNEQIHALLVDMRGEQGERDKRVNEAISGMREVGGQLLSAHSSLEQRVAGLELATEKHARDDRAEFKRVHKRLDRLGAADVELEGKVAEADTGRQELVTELQATKLLAARADTRVEMAIGAKEKREERRHGAWLAIGGIVLSALLALATGLLLARGGF